MENLVEHYGKNNFWFGKNVLITGHTGFKGAWLTLWLSKLGSNVTGIGLHPKTNPSLFNSANLEISCNHNICDIRELTSIKEIVYECKPDIIFHMAAQAEVLESYNDPLKTINTNIIGTANLLDVVKDYKQCKVVIVATTDKVYKQKNNQVPFAEKDSLGGHDPYSASKAACELMVETFTKSFLIKDNISIATARAGNVVGGGDWSEYRLIPDIIRSWKLNQKLLLRRPNAVRPWQHVIEALHGYMTMAEKLWGNSDLSGPYNIGPDMHKHHKVIDIVKYCSKAFNTKNFTYEVNQLDPIAHEEDWLMLDNSKMNKTFHVKPVWNIEETMLNTIRWYKEFYNGAKAIDLCIKDINLYIKTLVS